MFVNKRMLIGVITVLAVAVSFFISRQVTGIYDYSYWYTLVPVLIAELFIGLVIAEILNPDERSISMMIGHLSVAVLYFIFTVLSIFILNGNIGDNALLAVHIVVLFFAVILYIAFGMAHNASLKCDAQLSESLAFKKFFSVKIIQFKSMHADWLADNAEFNKLFEQLADDGKYASDTIPGIEDIDSAICAAMDKMNSCESADSALPLVKELIMKLEQRKATVKTLR